MIFRYFVLSFFCVLSLSLQAQKAIKGSVRAQNEPLPFATLQIVGTTIGTLTDTSGEFYLPIADSLWQKWIEGKENIVLKASFSGYTAQTRIFGYEDFRKQPILHQHFELKTLFEELQQVVVTGNRFEQAENESVVRVQLIDKATLRQVQACNLAEGLRFQSGVRLETNCQTCNYTQLRMNGLGGNYSQILIDNRPIFSALMGLYGLEQVSSQLVERIEIVRGGGSALYGANAIGGTVNVITKNPTEKSYEAGYTYQNIAGSSEHQVEGAANWVSKTGETGFSLLFNGRERDFYDHNGDAFSELPFLQIANAGLKFFHQPADNKTIKASLHHLYEYRFGGQMQAQNRRDFNPIEAAQAEEREHSVWIASSEYQYNFNQNNTKLSLYWAAQHTNRAHFTGIEPDEPSEIATYRLQPPYGTSQNQTQQIGFQLNHYSKKISVGKKDFGTHLLTTGAEFLYESIQDEIPAYRYLIDQNTQNVGFFLQSDWQLSEKFNLLSGLRLDRHNLVETPILSPRVAILYNFLPTFQGRVSWGKGFRAPQAFDSDLHIAFAGGGISRVQIAPDLAPEFSNSLSASLRYDKPLEKLIFGFTLEGFYTKLRNAFTLEGIGTDAFGEIFEKRNGAGATVGGTTFEARFNYDKKLQVEAGFTLQNSLFSEPIAYIEGLAPTRVFLRTPNEYGFFNLNFSPDKLAFLGLKNLKKRLQISFNGVYTGRMQVAHFAGAPEQSEDAYKTTPTFLELGCRMAYQFDLLGAKKDLNKNKTTLELALGMKNIANAYQTDFDTGKNRDSNFIYGAAQPRTIFVSIKIR
ncbi:TonB-dependent receptor [Hugenholtzia roseola]|uniref:TonB-dependent receptor n=1 Tax=Hugenholtzia roseola TaxID=1002 RepID=UPI00041BD6E2|nr:TonB-dependent receptor [Hugenholtzia roseola]